MTGRDASTLPLVTVVMNCYNGERFLHEAIDSVYAQNWPRWEILFWDNASTDNTASIARSYDERLRYFRAERNTSLGEARNLAFARAAGDYLIMLDCDDILLPDTLKRLVEGMSDGEREYAVCYAGIERIDAEGRVIGRVIPRERRGNLFGDLLLQFDLFTCASMVRRSVLVETGHGFDASLTTSEDVYFYMILAVDHLFQSLPEAIARYRIHEGALTNKSISRWADEWKYVIDRIVASHPGIEGQYKAGFRHIRARIDYYRARYLMHADDRAGARRLLRRNVFVDIRYFVLFLVSLAPVGFWNSFHTWYHKRSQFS